MTFRKQKLRHKYEEKFLLPTSTKTPAGPGFSYHHSSSASSGFSVVIHQTLNNKAEVLKLYPETRTFGKAC